MRLASPVLLVWVTFRSYLVDPIDWTGWLVGRAELVKWLLGSPSVRHTVRELKQKLSVLSFLCSR